MDFFSLKSAADISNIIYKTMLLSGKPAPMEPGSRSIEHCFLKNSRE
jgi:hypothetical protein